MSAPAVPTPYGQLDPVAFDRAIRPRTLTVSAVLARDPEVRTPILAPHDGTILARFVRPGARIAAGDVLLHLAPEPAIEAGASPADVTAVTAPTGGLVLTLAAIGARIACGATLATVLGGFVAEVTAGPDLGAFGPADVVDATVTCVGTRHRADVAAVITEGNTRRVRLRVADVANVLAVDAAVAVTLTIQPTAVMVEAEHAAKLKAWPYPIPPRGVHAVALGLIPPRSDPSTALARLSDAAPGPFSRPCARREAGAYIPPGCTEAASRPSHRHALALSRAAWEDLAVPTTPVRRGTLAVHLDAAGHRVREPAPEQAFAVTAPVAGHCRFARLFTPRDLVRVGEPVAVIALPPAVVDAQACYLAAPADGPERRHLAATLRRAGLREPELMTLVRTVRPLPEITVYAPIDGLVETGSPDGSVAAGATLLAVRAANTDFLTLRLSLAAFAALPPCVTVRVRGAPLSSAFAAPLIEVTNDATAGLARLRIPVPAGALGPEIASWVDLRLEDAASRRAAILVPQTCLAQVGRSCEALVHIDPGQLRPVSVAVGLHCDGFVEILEGLAGDETLVDDLEDLAAEDERVRALLLGFWQPSPRPHGVEDRTLPTNPLIE